MTTLKKQYRVTTISAVLLILLTALHHFNVIRLFYYYMGIAAITIFVTGIFIGLWWNEPKIKEVDILDNDL